MSTDRDDFYVGYLPTPASHRRFAKAAFLVVLVLAAGAGVGIAWLMDAPGDAVWESDTTSITGTIRVDPVVFLETPDGPVLLVEIGKFGPRDFPSIADGATVTVNGTMLVREGRRMVELAAGDGAVSAASEAPATRSAETSRRSVVIEGEIIDTKCFLGAMKPGRGRTHAACARLCIRGGIPAGIVGVTDGQPIWAVIDPGEAGIISETLLNAVGEQVRVEGKLSTSAGLAVLRDARLTPRD